MQQLSISARPRTLDALEGQGRIVKMIRGHVGTGRTNKAWLFCGGKGTGKTTLARIMALSLQCEHQKLFGAPCKSCRSKYRDFDIFPYNAAKATGIKDLEGALEGAGNAPRVGKYRIYIIDECHRLSSQAQALLLPYLEDEVTDTTIFILCSNMAHLVLDTVQRRCTIYKLRELDDDATTSLVTTLLNSVNSELPADRLAMVLADRGIASPGLIAQAVEKYVAGARPEDAADVEASTSVDVKGLTKAIVRGDWPGAAKYLMDAQNSDVQAIRLSSIAYMRASLLNCPEIAQRTGAYARAIDELAAVQRAEESVVAAVLAGAVYRATEFFFKHR